MKNLKLYCCIVLLLAIASSCKQKKDTETEEATTIVRTPVSVTTVTNEAMEDYVELNATSAFLQKTTVKATITGYIKSATIHYGSIITAGQQLFTIKTKEAESIGNTINKLDPSFKFSGVNSVKAASSGYITELNHKEGDYVQDGEQLAVISDQNSFVFLLEMPYEYRALLMSKKTLQLTMPDGEKLTGAVQQSLPLMDSTTQTQTIAIKVNASHPIPQGLVAKVKIIKNENTSASTLLKSAVLTNETQSEFWVMKMIDDSTAVKVPVKKGMETKDKVQIISPAFTPADKILISGNFGLADTARVVIQH